MPIYIALLVTLGGHFGIKGVAIAWSIRTLIDTILLIVYSTYYFRENRRINLYFFSL